MAAIVWITGKRRTTLISRITTLPAGPAATIDGSTYRKKPVAAPTQNTPDRMWIRRRTMTYQSMARTLPGRALLSW